MSLLPTSTADRRVRFLAWLSLVLNIVIIGTGGLVRLTGSGLGCPTWPTCTEDSFVNTPEMGIHGVIEFGNRALTGVLVVAALLTFLAVIRMWRTRRDLVVLAFFMGFGIPLQGVIGGITVLTGLNPYVVGLHFVLSLTLVVLSTVFVWRVYRVRAAGLVVPRWYATAGWALAGIAAVTVLVGIVTTGSGPHAGDAGAARNGLNSEILQHVHSWPAYTLFALTIVLLVLAVTNRYPKRMLAALLGVELAQIAVGLIQARTGLPEFLVGAHMVLAAIVVAFATTALLAMRAHRVPAASGDRF
ncbi:COX15/CtaA family protein [Pseudolysinimonas sp.]|uniref:COX15/CtaA family protein n=1 Tax=Pseudolysinimonas sp. TaxID=2680009 RepID=UPI00286BDB11|nr:COX15/CtaA family protein [Pseudolysinimonas sp.]